MDADFQEQYVTAEQAYSSGDFSKADALAQDLLERLKPLPTSGAERDANLAWRAFVALLLGHIHLYGKDDVSQGAEFYRLVLASDPQETLRELAQQGLDEAHERSPIVDVEISKEDDEDGAGEDNIQDEEPALLEIPSNQPVSEELIRDPFLQTGSLPEIGEKTATATIETAMPWLTTESTQSQPIGRTKQIVPSKALVEQPAANAAQPSTSDLFDADPKRLEAGLLRFTLENHHQLKSGEPDSAPSNRPTPQSWRHQLRLAWDSLRRR